MNTLFSKRLTCFLKENENQLIQVGALRSIHYLI